VPRASRPRREGALAPLGVLALLAAAPASAQVRVAPLEVARFHVGPLELTPTFAISNLGIDNNVFNDGRNRRDANLIMNPGLNAFLPVGRRIRVGGDGQMDVGWFTREGDERYVDLRGNAGAELDLGPLTLVAGARGGRQRQRFSIEVDDRIRRETHELSGGAGISLGARSLVVFEAFTGRLRFDSSTAYTPERGDQIRRALDRDWYGGRAELRYRLTDKTTAVVRGERREDEFVFDPEPRSSARRWDLVGGFDLAKTALVSGRLLAGVVSVPADEGQAVPPYTGLAIEASLSRNLAWFAQLRIAGRRDVSWAVSRGILESAERRNSFVDEHLSAELSLGLPLDAVLRTSLGQDRARFLLPVIQRGSELSRVDRRLTLRASLLWPIGQRIRLGGSVLWARRSSNFAGVGYEGWRYGLAAELIP
jgi:hypothetical protein